MNENNTSYSGEFIDEMLDLTEELDMSSLVRIQGYSMKSQDYPDSGMIDSDGVAYDGSFNLNFITFTNILSTKHKISNPTTKYQRHNNNYQSLFHLITTIRLANNMNK